jgi:hypothetical protein
VFAGGDIETADEAAFPEDHREARGDVKLDLLTFLQSPVVAR